MPRTQKQRNEETLRALLRAGGSLLREVGYARTSVAEITRRAHRAHGTFYLHFANKRELVAVLLDEMADDERRRVRDIWRDASTIDAIWLGHRDFLARIKEERSLWLLLEEVVALDADAAPLRSKLRHLYAGPVLRSLEGLGGQAIELPANLELLADLLISMGLYFARTGSLPASPEATALHTTVVWCKAIGLPITDSDLERLNDRFDAAL